MVAFLKYTDEQRRQAFLLTAQKKGLPEPIIEKDWWVSGNMIYGEKLPFEQLVARMKELEKRFRE